jgi:hypothetical protein
LKYCLVTLDILSYGYASNGNFARPNDQWMNAEAEEFSSADVIGILLDLEEHKLTFWKG